MRRAEPPLPVQGEGLSVTGKKGWRGNLSGKEQRGLTWGEAQPPPSLLYLLRPFPQEGLPQEARGGFRANPRELSPAAVGLSSPRSRRASRAGAGRSAPTARRGQQSLPGPDGLSSE